MRKSVQFIVLKLYKRLENPLQVKNLGKLSKTQGYLPGEIKVRWRLRIVNEALFMSPLTNTAKQLRSNVSLNAYTCIFSCVWAPNAADRLGFVLVYCDSFFEQHTK